MENYDWATTFGTIYHQAGERYKKGQRGAKALFTAGELSFLATIGCRGQELFDFVEDAAQEGEPDFATVLLVTAVRRDYFLRVQNGRPSGREIDINSLPSKQAAINGIVWLPRIIEKARAKLRGEMPAELMFFCGGDRAFLRRTDLHPADFLRVVWASGNETQAIVDFVKAAPGKN